MSDIPPDATQLPKAIDDDETIVRGILTPWHCKNGKLRRQALKPPAGSSELSVMRLRMGADFCKNKAVEIGSKNANNEYSGPMALGAAAIRRLNAAIEDTREPPNFLGHADVRYEFCVPGKDDPPATPEELKRIDDCLDVLLTFAIYHHDPDPHTPGWRGRPLKIE